MIAFADPVAAMLPSAFFALLFGVAATHKFTAWQLFRQQLADYRVLPAAAITPVAAVLPLLEGLVACGWLDAATRSAAAACSALLLAAYGGAMGWNLSQGRDLIDCGCGGTDGSQVIRPALVVRNLLLAALALGLAASGVLAAAPLRTMGWIDWLTVFGGALSVMGIYVAINQILANLPPQRVLD